MDRLPPLTHVLGRLLFYSTMILFIVRHGCVMRACTPARPPHPPGRSAFNSPSSYMALPACLPYLPGRVYAMRHAPITANGLGGSSTRPAAAVVLWL